MPTAIEVFNQISGGYKSLNQEVSSLEPTAPVYLYEIDLSLVYPEIRNIAISGQAISNGILRFHNNFNIFNLNNQLFDEGQIYWQNNYYYPFPIIAEGFDYTSAGTSPTPGVTLANFNPDGTENSFYKYVRMQTQSLGDIVGAKFTRIRTFLKYLNGINFSGNINPYTDDPTISEIELPRDVYYIDRKTKEDKSILQYSLVSILDLENLTLPNRPILANKCPFQYRGEGCLYEYDKRKAPVHSGIYGEVNTSPVEILLPLEAPPVATDNDELFLNTILSGINSQRRFSGYNYFRAGASTYDYGNSWSFFGYTLNSGTASGSARGLNDNLAGTAVTSLATNGAYIQLELKTGAAEITQVRLTTSSTVNNNYKIEYSRRNGSWNSVKDISGYDLSWNLTGRAAGTYQITFPSVGIHTGWRFTTTNAAASTAITEFNFSGQSRIGDKGLWQTGVFYTTGDFVYLQNNNINYYFVCITEHNSDVFNNPPNRKYWGADVCSKTQNACRLRWKKNPYFKPVVWPMTRGGWDYWTFLRKYFVTGDQYYVVNNIMDPNLRRLIIPAWFNTGNFFQDGRPASWPRRPDVHDPWNEYAHGLPKDITGQYLNGFLPFGGFPGVDKVR